MPLVEFPIDGDKFFINKPINTLSSVGSMVALTLGKYGVDVDFSGAVGEDDLGRIIREKFESYQVKTKYIETCYTEKTACSYKIYNSKSNKFTSINEAANELSLKKYKYEFVPEVIIMDDKDYNANLAAISNYPKSLLIFIADKFTKESSVYCNKCKYVIANIGFACGATGVTDATSRNKNMVNLFQKFIDLYNANLIIKLDNFDMLYLLNDEVRLIKNVNKNINNKENVYYSILVYFLMNKYDVETAIKLTNKVMLSSANEIDLIEDIPDYKVITEVINEYNIMCTAKEKVETTTNYESEQVQNVEETMQNQQQPVQQNPTQQTQIVQNQNAPQQNQQQIVQPTQPVQPVQVIENQTVTPQVQQSTIVATPQQANGAQNQNINVNGVNNG